MTSSTEVGPFIRSAATVLPVTSTVNQTLLRTDRSPRALRLGPQGGKPLRPYEVMVILDSGLEDDVIRATIDRATTIIAKEGGSVGRVDRWGKRRFAYEVNHRSEGYYALIEATAEPAAMAVLDRALGLADEVVRHKVIRLPDKVAGRSTRRPANEPSPTVASSANGA